MPQTFLNNGMKALLLKGTAAATLTSISGLTLTALTVGSDVVDISDLLVVDATDIQQTSSDTIDERVYSDKGKVSIPTLKNGSATLVLRRLFTALGAPDTTDPLQYFNNRQKVAVIIFTGQGRADAVAAGDEYFGYIGQADRCMPENKPTGGYAKLTVDLLFAGDVGTSAVAA